jgi:hypothetical protein
MTGIGTPSSQSRIPRPIGCLLVRSQTEPGAEWATFFRSESSSLERVQAESLGTRLKFRTGSGKRLRPFKTPAGILALAPTIWTDLVFLRSHSQASALRLWIVSGSYQTVQQLGLMSVKAQGRAEAPT